jgi:hypothetical protein
MLSLLAFAVVVVAAATPVIVRVLWRHIEAKELARQYYALEW